MDLLIVVLQDNDFVGFRKNNVMIVEADSRSHAIIPKIDMEKPAYLDG